VREIFISYRKSDTRSSANHLYEDLIAVFGEEQVFLDKEDMHAGNWREQLDCIVKGCKVILVVIGRSWLTVTDERKRPRIHLPEDTHRREIAIGLRRPDVTVIPVLVEEASMPSPDQLPEDLQELHEKQSRRIGDSRKRRKVDLEDLVRDIQIIGGVQVRATPSIDRATQRRTPWSRLRFDQTSVVTALVLTLLAGMLAFPGGRLREQELVVLFILFYGLTKGGKCIWQRLKKDPKEKHEQQTKFPR
jgi:hypothetical protein